MKPNSKDSIRSTLVLTAMAMLFALSLAWLFALRFEAGDVLPGYSSLRPDPLGTKVLFEALSDLDGVRAIRNFEPLPRLESGLDDPQGTTLLMPGSSTGLLGYPEEQVPVLIRLAMSGTRVVIAFNPVWDGEEAEDDPEPKSEKEAEKEPEKASKDPKGPATDKTEDKKKKSDPEKTPPKDPEKADSDSKETIEKDSKELKGWEKLKAEGRAFLKKHLNLGYDIASKGKKDEKIWADPGDPSSGLTRVSWHSGLFFDQIGTPWRVVYRCQDRPVVIERAYGKGSIVLVGDSFLLSNEALSRELKPGFLTWLVGPGKDGRLTVVFDEAHFGLMNRSGVAVLARRYGLQGLAGGLLILAGLFIWRQTSRMVPLADSGEEDHEEEAASLSGRDASSGLVSLIRRNMPRDKILDVCFEEWKKSPEGRKASPETLEKIREVLEGPEARSDPVSAYRAVAGILAEKRKWIKTRPS